MKKYAIMISSIFLLVACNSSDNLAKKKQECLRHKASLEKEHNDNFALKGFVFNKFISKIFYSAKRDSCLYVLEESSLQRNDDPGTNESVLILRLYDLLANEEVISFQGCGGKLHCGLTPEEAEEKFFKELSKYE